MNPWYNPMLGMGGGKRMKAGLTWMEAEQAAICISQLHFGLLGDD